MAKRYIKLEEGKDNRPYILFKRLKNRGLNSRGPRTLQSGKNTGKVIPGFPGAQWEEWSCALVQYKEPNSPHNWVSPSWLTSKTSADCFPIDSGNMDKLPPDYPSEWRQKLEEVIHSVKGIADMNRARLEAEKALAEGHAQLEARIKEMNEKQALLDAPSINENTKADGIETELPGPTEGSGNPQKQVGRAPKATRQAAV